MSRVPDLIFEYRRIGKFSSSRKGTIGIIISLIIFLLFLAGFVIFVYAAFKINAKYIWLANLSGILAFIFGPFSYIKRKYYYFALTEDGVLIIKNIIGIFPRTYKIELNDVTKIEYLNPVKSLVVVFKNKNEKTIGSFNHYLMGYNQFKRYLDVISSRNKNIEIKV